MAFEITLGVATLLCSLVVGLLLGFVVVVMPGIRVLPDRDFLRAFQVMDGVIQRGQPVFGLVWIGSVVALVTAVALGFGRLEGLDRALLLIATAGYLGGTQLPTALVNIPMNNRVQGVDVAASTDEECRSARADFEDRWNRWNASRTVFGLVSTGLLLALLGRL